MNRRNSNPTCIASAPTPQMRRCTEETQILGRRSNGVVVEVCDAPVVLHAEENCAAPRVRLGNKVLKYLHPVAACGGGRPTGFGSSFGGSRVWPTPPET